MEFYIFLFITAVIFTFAGINMSAIRINKINKKIADIAITACIDKLIKDGYLKTQGTGESMLVLKWDELHNDKTN